MMFKFPKFNTSSWLTSNAGTCICPRFIGFPALNSSNNRLLTTKSFQKHRTSVMQIYEKHNDLYMCMLFEMFNKKKVIWCEKYIPLRMQVKCHFPRRYQVLIFRAIVSPVLANVAPPSRSNTGISISNILPIQLRTSIADKESSP